VRWRGEGPGQGCQADGEDAKAGEAGGGQVLAEHGQPEDRGDGRLGEAERRCGCHRGDAQPPGVAQVRNRRGEHGEVAGHGEAPGGGGPAHRAGEQDGEKENGRAAEDGADDGVVLGAAGNQIRGRDGVDRVAEAGGQRQGDARRVGGGGVPAGDEHGAARHRRRRRGQPAGPRPVSLARCHRQDAGEDRRRADGDDRADGDAGPGGGGEEGHLVGGGRRRADGQQAPGAGPAGKQAAQRAAAQRERSQQQAAADDAGGAHR
jgi:hypothetical protein